MMTLNLVHWGYSSWAKHLPKPSKVLGSNPSITKTQPSKLKKAFYI